MEYSEIFIPVPSHLQTANAAQSAERMGNAMKFGVKGFEWEWLSGFKIALVGLRKSGAPNSFSALREELYALFAPQKNVPIIDLGDVELTDSVGEKVAYALQRIFAEGVFPIVFSENMHNAEWVYNAVKAQHKNVAATFVLPHANVGSVHEPLCNENLLAHLMADYGRELSTLNLLGYQNYLTSPTDVKMLNKQYCELLRLGAIRDSILCAEPLLRDADLLCAGLNAVRQCDAPAAVEASPNGLYAEEMCRLLRYASFSDKLKACYLGSFNLANDNAQRQTAKLAAQLIWHVAEGFAYRVGDEPAKSRMCRRLRVQMGRGQHILFYQSKATDRWWMSVPVDGTANELAIPCLRDDYDRAAHGEIPDRWLWFYKKLSAQA
ncbi:MAG: hypothetical protein LBU92_00940 [Prevotellaceae bacterium]|jgi:hypothetical protein|nr:hypothetical protein [Prevotellaceae bacterium]